MLMPPGHPCYGQLGRTSAAMQEPLPVCPWQGCGKKQHKSYFPQEHSYMLDASQSVLTVYSMFGVLSGPDTASWQVPLELACVPYLFMLQGRDRGPRLQPWYCPGTGAPGARVGAVGA